MSPAGEQGGEADEARAVRALASLSQGDGALQVTHRRGAGGAAPTAVVRVASSGRQYEVDSAVRASAEALYDEVGIAMIRDFVQGYNTCLLAYGAPSSGQGALLFGTGDQPGGFVRAVSKALCQRLRDAPPRGAAVRRHIAARAQLFELSGQGEVRDLLDENDDFRPPELWTHPLRGIAVDDMAERRCDDWEHFVRHIDPALCRAAKRRGPLASTHIVYQVTLYWTDLFEEDGESTVRHQVSTMSVYDVSCGPRGTEDPPEPQSPLERVAQGLSAIARCGADGGAADDARRGELLDALRAQIKECTLTHLLAEPLSGNCLTTALACADGGGSDTERVLQLAERLRAVRCIIRRSSTTHGTMSAVIQQQLAELRQSRTAGTAEDEQQVERDIARRSEVIRLLENFAERVKAARQGLGEGCRAAAARHGDPAGSGAQPRRLAPAPAAAQGGLGGGLTSAPRHGLRHAPRTAGRADPREAEQESRRVLQQRCDDLREEMTRLRRTNSDLLEQRREDSSRRMRAEEAAEAARSEAQQLRRELEELRRERRGADPERAAQTPEAAALRGAEQRWRLQEQRLRSEFDRERNDWRRREAAARAEEARRWELAQRERDALREDLEAKRAAMAAVLEEREAAAAAECAEAAQEAVELHKERRVLLEMLREGKRQYGRLQKRLLRKRQGPASPPPRCHTRDAAAQCGDGLCGPVAATPRPASPASLTGWDPSASPTLSPPTRPASAPGATPPRGGWRAPQRQGSSSPAPPRPGSVSRPGAREREAELWAVAESGPLNLARVMAPRAHPRRRRASLWYEEDVLGRARAAARRRRELARALRPPFSPSVGRGPSAGAGATAHPCRRRRARPRSHAAAPAQARWCDELSDIITAGVFGERAGRSPGRDVGAALARLAETAAPPCQQQQPQQPCREISTAQKWLAGAGSARRPPTRADLAVATRSLLSEAVERSERPMLGDHLRELWERR